MTENVANVSVVKVGEAGMVRARVVWALRRMGVLLLVLWVLYPTTADRLDYSRVTLLGFLYGAFYGLLLYGNVLLEYVKGTKENKRFTQNRVPEEYYWGNISKILFDNR